MNRVGFGFDVHRLVPGRRLVLGGEEIPSTRGLLGHSDADVLLHAIADALLGAAALGDIGKHFPDTDPSFKDISSLRLLGEVARLIAGQRLQVANIDSTVVLESPKISSYVDKM
ncbi:MAG TPA: 2-C-methyl-D-erythritol 2,4-cyclodiphosphate synthase, partial [Bacteroidota bacterium]|nr:2-C-methyl-D-erythritol 2,4-cyclodiphosphate synthase [Bacteroidota bacterium]